MRRQPTIQQISWFLDLERNNQLDLNPPYQRRSVWAPKDRRFFLDTIFRNYPTPPLFIHRKINDNGHTMYHIVDGKQRLETILNFAKNKIAIDPNFGDTNLNGKKFNDLDIEYKKRFWDYSLVVDFIESIDGTNIEEVFDRVNRNSMNLQPQELRHARFNGWFIQEAEGEAEKDFWWDIKVSSRGKEKRMKNIQFIAELLLVILENKIVGFSQDYLDEMFAIYDSLEENESFDEDEYFTKKETIKRYIQEMQLHNSCITTFAKTFNNLYTLWALISLSSNLPPAADLADQYHNFMTDVESLSQVEPEEQITAAEERNLTQQLVYAQNSKGASTDLAQRTNRLSALKTAFNIA